MSVKEFLLSKVLQRIMALAPEVATTKYLFISLPLRI